MEHQRLVVESQSLRLKVELLSLLAHLSTEVSSKESQSGLTWRSWRPLDEAHGGGVALERGRESALASLAARPLWARLARRARLAGQAALTLVALWPRLPLEVARCTLSWRMLKRLAWVVLS